MRVATAFCRVSGHLGGDVRRVAVWEDPDRGSRLLAE